MIALANYIAAAILIGLGLLFKEIQWTYGHGAISWACAGWIAATVMWQVAHKIRYGVWFDTPTMGPTKAPPDLPKAAGN